MKQTATLTLTTAPRTGATMVGTWRLDPPRSFDQSSIRIRCTHILRSTQAGSNGMAMPLWEQEVPGISAEAGISFSIPLPEKAPGSFESKTDRVRWECCLVLSDTTITQEIPITGNPVTGYVSPVTETVRAESGYDLEASCRKAGITLEQQGSRIGLRFPGLRPYWLVCLGLFTHVALVSGFVYAFLFAMRQPHQPLRFFDVTFISFFACYLLLFANLYFRRRAITVDSDGIDLRSGWLVPWRRQMIANAHIYGFHIKRSSMSMTGSNPQYVVSIDHGQPRRFLFIFPYVHTGTYGRMDLIMTDTRDRRLCQAIVAELERILGPRTEAGRGDSERGGLPA